MKYSTQLISMAIAIVIMFGFCKENRWVLATQPISAADDDKANNKQQPELPIARPHSDWIHATVVTTNGRIEVRYRFQFCGRSHAVLNMHSLNTEQLSGNLYLKCGTKIACKEIAYLSESRNKPKQILILKDIDKLDEAVAVTGDHELILLLSNANLKESFKLATNLKELQKH